jgi:hypothetical protein
MKIIVFIVFAIVYFYSYMFSFIRLTALPVVDGNIANVLHKKVVVTPTTQQECFRVGGEWRRPGPWPKETCMVPYTDGGKVCYAGLQCEARDCLYASGPTNRTIVATGKCPKYQIYFGCIQKVHFGITGNAVCLD